MEIRKEVWGWSLWCLDPKKVLVQVGARVGDTAPEFNEKHFVS